MNPAPALVSDLVAARVHHSVVGGASRHGEHVEALIDPATGSEWGETSWSVELVDEAVDGARTAFREGAWSARTRTERADVLEAIGRAVLEHVDEVAVLESLANGKPLKATRAEVAASARWWQYYASLLRTLRDERIELTSTKRADIDHEPVGVVAVITPFNGAFSLGTWKLAPALAAGNSVVIKPPLNSPGSSIVLHRIATAAGLPAGVLHIVQGGAEVGERLVGHTGVDMVSFTGSTAASMKVGQAVSGRLARFVAEAGGKSAHIVFDDADLQGAVTAVVQGGFSGSGQICVAGSRVLVQRRIADEFARLLVERISRLTLGNPADDSTLLGPIASRQQYERVVSLIDDAITQGATVLAGGSSAPAMPQPFDGGYWIEPTVLKVTSNSAPICQTEVFGPVLTVLEFDTEEEALAIANESPFGLAAGFWTSDMGRAHRLGRGIQAGTVWINTYRGMDWQTPFGGYKLSGLGRENGVEGLREFQQLKSVVQEFGTAADPFGLA